MKIKFLKGATILSRIPVGVREDGEIAYLILVRAEGGVHCLVSGMNGAGKALTLDTPVPTPTGWATMGELRAGDLVYDEQGQPCKVVTAWPVRHDRPCYDVVFSDGSVVTADEDHLWEVETRSSRSNKTAPKVLTTGEMIGQLRAGTDPGTVNYSVRVTAPLSAPDADLPIDPYTLGVWLGDGTAVTGVLTLNRDDAAEIEARLGYSYRRIPSADRPGCVATRVEGLTAALRVAGLISNKHIPPAYFRASEYQRRALLAGLLDSDGYASTAGGVVFAVSDERLATDTRSLIATLGYKSALTSKPARLNGVDCGTQWVVSFTPPDRVFTVSRKADRQVTTVRASAARRFITDIRPVPSRPVRCITVDSPHSLYLVGDQCITTHNTWGEIPVLLTAGALRTDQILIDTVKGIQSYQDVAGCLQMYEIDPGRAKKLLRQLLNHVLPARTNHLAREGLKQWAPSSTLRFLRIHIEEAWKLAEAKELVGLGVALRSAGGQLTISVQQPTWDNMPTTLRNQMGSFRAYGLADADYNEYSLPEAVVAAGANPARWGNEDPGMHYLSGPGMTIREKTMAVRSFADGTGDNTFASAAAWVAANLGEMDPVNVAALGDLWTTHIAPLDLVKQVGLIVPGPVTGPALVHAARAVTVVADPVDDDTDGVDGFDPDDAEFLAAIEEMYDDDPEIETSELEMTGDRIVVTTDSGDNDFQLDASDLDPDDELADPNAPTHPTVARMIGDPPKDGLTPEEFRQVLDEVVTAFLASGRDRLERVEFTNILADAGWSPASLYKYMAKDDRVEKSDRGWIAVRNPPGSGERNEAAA